MKMDKVANSGNDEFYTPEYAITPLLPYLNKNSRVWCPFDTGHSLYKQILEAEGHEVVCTHLANGEDFFKIDPPQVWLYYIQPTL